MSRSEADEIKKLVESYQTLFEKQKKLQKRLMRVSGNNPMQEESLLQRLEGIEQKLEFLTSVVYESGVLSHKEECILDFRLDGFTYNQIGDFLNISRQNIHKAASGAYEKLSLKFKEAI